MAQANDQQVLVRMPRDLHRALKERAEREDRTMASAMRHAVRTYVDS